MTDTLSELLQAQLHRGIFTHAYASCGLLCEQQSRYTFTHHPDTCLVFDLASLTKALVTLPLYVNAKLSGDLCLDAKIATLLHDSTHKLSDTLAQLSIVDLLSHRSGLPAWRNFWIGTLGKEHTLSAAKTIAMLNRSATQLQNRQPHYSDLNYILAGLCLEIWQNKSLDTLFTEFCQTQLRFLPRQHFGFRPAAQDRAIPSAYCHIRERWLQGEVHDENCAACGGVSGHAGLFGSGDDLVTYLRTLFAHRVGQEILHKNSIMLVSTPHTRFARGSLGSLGSSPLPSSCLFGMQRGANGVLSAHGSLLGHLGFTGTSFWLDPQQGSYSVLLTNRTINARLVPHFHTLRQQVFRAMQSRYLCN